MTWTGTARRLDLGTGVWVLETGGERITLYGSLGEELDGREVVVEGKEVENMGFGMVGGRAVEVATVRRTG
jgi:hypothetical protein